jgi:hypothetical protein
LNMRLDACAYHEAGHAVVGHLLGHRVKRIHIGICGGITTFHKSPQNAEHLVLIVREALPKNTTTGAHGTRGTTALITRPSQHLN